MNMIAAIDFLVVFKILKGLENIWLLFDVGNIGEKNVEFCLDSGIGKGFLKEFKVKATVILYVLVERLSVQVLGPNECA